MEPTTTNTTIVDASRGWEDALYETVAFIPKLLAFAAILIIGYFVAKFIGKVVDRVLTKVGFDRAVEKSGIKQALANSGYHPAGILGKIAFYGVLLFVMQLAFGVFGPNPISELLTRVIAFLPNIAVAVVLVVIAASIANAVKDIIKGALGGLSYGQMLANVAAVAIIGIGVFAALTQLNIAPQIVLGLFYAMLAIVVGVSVIAIGGGGIQPMRQRWEMALNKMDQEIPRVKQEVRAQTSGTLQAQPDVMIDTEDRRGYLG